MKNKEIMIGRIQEMRCIILKSGFFVFATIEIAVGYIGIDCDKQAFRVEETLA